MMDIEFKKIDNSHRLYEGDSAWKALRTFCPVLHEEYTKVPSPLRKWLKSLRSDTIQVVVKRMEEKDEGWKIFEIILDKIKNKRGLNDIKSRLDDIDFDTGVYFRVSEMSEDKSHVRLQASFNHQHV